MFRKGFRPRAESRAMNYISIAVGLVSGYYIFQPYFEMKKQSSIASVAANASNQNDNK